MAQVGFGVLAACLLLSAIFVVRAKNLVHGVLWLGATLVVTAAFFVMLEATFLAGVQVMLYVGGVVTLMAFGVMLTRRHDGRTLVAGSSGAGRAALAAAAIFGVVAQAVMRGELPATPAAATATTAELGTGLVTTHVLAFEVLSFLLLAAIIGAIVIARRRDPGEPAPKLPARKVRPLAPEVER